MAHGLRWPEKQNQGAHLSAVGRGAIQILKVGISNATWIDLAPEPHVGKAGCQDIGPRIGTSMSTTRVAMSSEAHIGTWIEAGNHSHAAPPLKPSVLDPASASSCGNLVELGALKRQHCYDCASLEPQFATFRCRLRRIGRIRGEWWFWF